MEEGLKGDCATNRSLRLWQAGAMLFNSRNVVVQNRNLSSGAKVSSTERSPCAPQYASLGLSIPCHRCPFHLPPHHSIYLQPLRYEPILLPPLVPQPP